MIESSKDFDASNTADDQAECSESNRLSHESSLANLGNIQGERIPCLDEQSNVFRFVTPVIMPIFAIGFITVIFLVMTGYDFSRIDFRKMLNSGAMSSHNFSQLYRSWGISSIPPASISSVAYDNLIKIEKEPCDWNAFQALTAELVTENENRLAANIYSAFPKSCDVNGQGDREAANIFYQMKDFKNARAKYEGLVSLYPNGDLDWYHKAQAEHALGMMREALDSFEHMMSLTENQSDLGEWVFTEMSDIYSSLGQFCEAMTPISTFIYLDPANRDNSRMRDMLASLSQKGNCTSYAGGSDSFPVLNSDTIIVRAKVNGIDGTFVIDTGASFVSVNQEFAARAGITTTGTKRMTTANGEADALLSKATSIRLGNLRADDVPLVVLSKSMKKLDGLLGRSFLSRFDMTITKSRLTLKSKSSDNPLRPQSATEVRAQTPAAAAADLERSMSAVSSKTSQLGELNGVSDQPQLGDNNARQHEGRCDVFMFNANAIFIRATTFCQKNYMDSKAGYAALAETRKCAIPEQELKQKLESAMRTLDSIVVKRGRSAACAFVEDLAAQVNGR